MADVVLGVHVEDVVSASTDRSLAHSLLIRTTWLLDQLCERQDRGLNDLDVQRVDVPAGEDDVVGNGRDEVDAADVSGLEAEEVLQFPVVTLAEGMEEAEDRVDMTVAAIPVDEAPEKNSMQASIAIVHHIPQACKQSVVIDQRLLVGLQQLLPCAHEQLCFLFALLYSEEKLVEELKRVRARGGEDSEEAVLNRLLRRNVKDRNGQCQAGGENSVSAVASADHLHD
mmetsp:Transcript_19000/g.43607  ORF Transcript_19000/g.43607 Transcript_19000/m.43607 type:complete len:227 (+) Transcript_19000:215-895(+)